MAMLQKGIKNETVVVENLRYAIYLRKSTDDPENEERESAKEASIRPLFRKLLDRVIAGELDGIIAWN